MPISDVYKPGMTGRQLAEAYAAACNKEKTPDLQEQAEGKDQNIND